MNRTTAPKVLHIALDGCDPDLMLQLAAAGRCPAIGELVRDGAVVDAAAPYGTFVGSSWMTITTADDVGNHRYWNWMEVDPATYALQLTSPREARGRPYWQRLSDAGRRVAVFDVPHADASVPIDGVVVKEWGCHDRHDGTASHPASLLDELDELVGRHPVGGHDHPAGHAAFAPCDHLDRAGAHRTVEEERELLDRLRQGIDAKHRASAWLMEREPWDLFVTVFGEAHCVGHQLWHVHDEHHPWHDASVRRLLGDPVADVYRRLDRAVGDLVARVPFDTPVYLLLNHGMGPHFDGDHLLDQILERIDGHLSGEFRAGSWTSVGAAVTRRRPAPLRGAVDRSIATAARVKARHAPPALSSRPGPRPDRRFFALPGNTSVGAIRFNLVGREACGTVRRGTELQRLTDALRAALTEVVDIDTGRRLVRAVVPAEDVLDKHPDDRLPDLFVEWERSSLVERVWSPVTGTVAARYDHWRTGDHHDRGLLVVRGPGIAPGRRVDPIRLTDVAPTIAATMGVHLDGVDGRARVDLVGVTPDRAPHGDEGPAEQGISLAERLEHAVQAVESLERRSAQHDAELTQLRHSAFVAARERMVWTTMAWLAQEPPVDTLVSVITPTYHRPQRLAEAIRSVVAQRHERWEMIVVDDGSATAAKVAAEVGDDRVRVIDADHGGACHARNIGLDHARGEIVTYLDDDNWLDPGWLHAVAWAFRAHPEHTALYGARVFDDAERSYGPVHGPWPWLHFQPYDRTALEQDNIADMGVIAHRAGLDARFDVSLVECGDWDFLLSLTEHQAPLELPVVAFYYRTDGHDRLTGLRPSDHGVVRSKWQRRRAAMPAVSPPADGALTTTPLVT